MPDKTPELGVGVYVSGPNCWKCHHFAVSWDHTKPYACRLMGFKSRVLPAMEVLRTDGTACLGFTEKQNRPKIKVVDASPATKEPNKPERTRRKLTSTQMWEA